MIKRFKHIIHGRLKFCWHGSNDIGLNYFMWLALLRNAVYNFEKFNKLIQLLKLISNQYTFHRERHLQRNLNRSDFLHKRQFDFFPACRNNLVVMVFAIFFALTKFDNNVNHNRFIRTIQLLYVFISL